MNIYCGHADRSKLSHHTTSYTVGHPYFDIFKVKNVGMGYELTHNCEMENQWELIILEGQLCTMGKNRESRGH